MFIYFILTCVCAGLSVVVMAKSGTQATSVSKAVFNYSHWTLIWTILFVYSIEVSAFIVFFGQLFKRRNFFLILAYSILNHFLLSSSIGKTSRCRYLDRHIHWLLSHSTCRTSIFSVLSSQCWTTLLHSSFTTIWTTKWSVHCKILLRRMSDWLIDCCCCCRWHRFISTDVYEYIRLSIIYWHLFAVDVSLLGHVFLFGDLCWATQSGRIRCLSAMELSLQKI